MIKWQYSLKLIYKLNAFSVNSQYFFSDIDKLILKFTWTCKGLRIANIEKKIKMENLHQLLNLKTFYEAMVIQIVWPWQKNKHILSMA